MLEPSVVSWGIGFGLLLGGSILLKKVVQRHEDRL